MIKTLELDARDGDVESGMKCKREACCHLLSFYFGI
jgi:hypothetical protein